jgi:hypothetical protein
MENIWGINISRIALPEEKLSYNEWMNELKVSSNYRSNTNDNADFLNNQYNFSLIKNRQNESTNNGA